MARNPRKGERTSKKRRGGKSAPKRRSAPEQARKKTATKSTGKPARRPSGRAATNAEVVRLASELNEARRRQAATAEILNVIARSPDDVKPVFEAIARIIVRVVQCDRAHIMRCDGNSYYPLAIAVLDGSFSAPASHAERIDPAANFPSRAIVSKQTVHYPDWSLIELPEYERGIRDRYGMNSSLYLPLMRREECMGLLALSARQTDTFDEGKIALAESFRDQALIAIENARLFKETREALAQQTATSEVLRVISNSVADTAPVFEKILDSCENLFASEQLGIFLLRPDGQVHAGAWRGAALETVTGTLPRPGEQTATGIVIRNRAVLHIPNTAEVQNLPPTVREMRDQIGDLSIAWAPMLGEEGGVGSISVMRQPPNPFSEKELTLLKTFADQAVIAIQNTRLFNETREALERQTATADILKVIASSPDDVQPVFQAIADRSNRLVDALSTTVFTLVDGMMYLRAFTPVTPEADAVLQASFPAPLSSFSWGESIGKGKIYRVIDAEREPEHLRDLARERGWRSCLCIALMRDGKPIGMIGPTRVEPGPFSDHHVQLMQTFADQAVIAIENTRLFNETKEALERQTATADILKVIASSPDDVQPVFDAIAERSTRLVKGLSTAVYSLIGDMLHLMAFTPISPDADAMLRAAFPTPLASMGWGEAIGKGKLAFVADAEVDLVTRPYQRQLARLRGWRSWIGVPLLRDGNPIGVITVTRIEPGRLDDRHVQILKTFADQAVIAISNVELFQQVQNRTKELSESLQFQTAASDVLKVISQSPDRLQPVLDAIVTTSRELCGSDASTIFLLRDRKFHFAALAGTAPKNLQDIRTNPLNVDAPGSLFGRLLQEKRTLHYANVMDDPELSQGRTGLGGPRALLVAPLLNKGEVIGAIVLRQSHLKPFTERQIQAIEVFADQAVIAISNVELFQQVQTRTRELSQSLDDLRAAQDRLVQTEKLASLGQLTAGIAHEIKNPLNFVNNFSALSAELIEELNESLAAAALDAKTRGDVSELTATLKGNLEKVVQHGRRADSIVKNMLLHSRQGSGEQRSADINTLVEESLNLAYHGARAERSDFNITLKRDLDPGAGAIELYPQEITRALLNMISNGFYAATKRAGEAGNDFEPTLQAATRALSDRVEIRIRDNGTGIPPEVKGKMFNPFFTTKPAGEGTGLGLSMTHDIIVKQHGGTIDVESEPGSFTEFIIVLPRTNSFQNRKS